MITNMADAKVLAQRREARRQRILQNSNDRLRRIANVDAPNNSSEDSREESARNVIEDSLNNSGDAVGNQNYASSDDINLTQTDSESSFASHDGHVRQETPSTEGLHKSSSQGVLSHSLLEYGKIHIILLATFVRIFLASEYGSLFSQSIFIPLFTVEVVQILYLYSIGRSRSSSVIAGILLLLVGLPQEKVLLITHFVGTLKAIGVDLCIYTFTFVIVHMIWSSAGY